jgi:hypothetical protein
MAILTCDFPPPTRTEEGRDGNLLLPLFLETQAVTALEILVATYSSQTTQYL